MILIPLLSIVLFLVQKTDVDAFQTNAIVKRVGSSFVRPKSFIPRNAIISNVKDYLSNAKKLLKDELADKAKALVASKFPEKESKLLQLLLNVASPEVPKLITKDFGIPNFQIPDAKIFSDLDAAKFFDFLAPKSVKDVVNFLALFVPTLTASKIESASKQDVKIVAELQKVFVDKVILGSDVDQDLFLPKDYLYFGSNKDTKRILKELLKSNPFFASALKIKKTDGKITFEIKSTDTEPTFFSRIIDNYDSAFPRINAVFDEKLDLISFEAIKGGAPIKITEEEALSRLTFLLSYYFEVTHTTIHIFHFLTVAGLLEATANYKELSAFADQYAPNVFLKFVEVLVLLIPEGGGLFGKIYSGKRDKIVPVISDILISWGNSASADEFLEKSLLKNALTLGRAPLAEAGILTEFFKHSDLVKGYADGVNEVFANINSAELKLAEEKLDKFLTASSVDGKGFAKIKNLRTWIELLAVTGILHGATLSASRVILNPIALKHFTEGETYGSQASAAFQTVLGTLVGVAGERQIFSELSQDQSPNPLLLTVVHKFHGLSSGYKLDYYKQVRYLEDFKEYGWIWSDYLPDLIDGKQFTIATYV